MQANAPVPVVVCDVQPWVPGVAPLNVKVAIPVLGENEDPVTATVTPFGPCAGDNVIVGTSTVKVVEAESPVTVPTSLPDAVTVFAPLDEDGTVKVHVKAPVAEVVCEVQVCVDGVAPLKVNVLIGMLVENPLPVTVTLFPEKPCVGVRVIVAVVTVKVAESITDVLV